MSDLAKYPEGRVEVRRDGSIIIVTLIGWLTEELTELLQKQIEDGVCKIICVKGQGHDRH